MNPQSRTDAHKTFANLYRKTRDPEHQKLIDELLSRSNDVFIRIDLIKKADEEYFKNKSGKVEVLPERKPQKYDLTDEKKQKPKPKAQPDAGGGGGFLTTLFGGNPAITKFAKETGAIDIGIFGRKPVISKSVEKIFRSLREDQIISTIQALKFTETQGWRVWTPLVYNVVLNYNRFFNSFIALDSLFMDEISPETFLNRSTKMHMYYARILARPDTRDIILKHVPELMKTDEKLKYKMDLIIAGLDYGLSLENEHPTLTEAICAFHIVTTKKIVTWEEVNKLLNVSPIDEFKFKAANEVIKEIDLSLAKVTEDIKSRLIRQEDLTGLRNNFFKFDDNGKISFDFLNGIIDHYVEHHYPEGMQTGGLKSSFKTIPHKLLYLVVRDFQSTYLTLLEGYIKVTDASGNQKEILLIQLGLFFQEIEKITLVIRSLDGFNKKYPSFQYSFQSFTESLTKGAQDQIESMLLKIFSEASDVFGKFAMKLKILVDNHISAKNYERDGNLSERIHGSREKTVEELKSLTRFLPYYNYRVNIQGRMLNRTVEEVFTEMTRLLFNYAVIFKDPVISAKLTSHKKIDQELGSLLKEYERLSGHPWEDKKVES